MRPNVKLERKCAAIAMALTIVAQLQAQSVQPKAHRGTAEAYPAGDSVAAQITTTYDEVRDTTLVMTAPMAVGFGIHMVAGGTFTGRHPVHPAAHILVTFAIESTSLEHENDHSVVFLSPYGKRLRLSSEYLSPRYVSNGVIESVALVLTIAQARQLVAGQNAMGEIGDTDITIGSGQMKVIAELVRRMTRP